MENENNAQVVKTALAKSTRPGTLAGLKSTDIATVLSGMKAQIAQALPRHMTPDRMIQMATTIIAKNPKIAECTAASLMGAVMQASLLGFQPIEALGECYFVPYAGKVQFQVGYKGYISLARRSDQIKMIYAEVVHEGDDFEYELGLEPKLHHVPGLDNEGNKMTHVYAVAHYTNGGYSFMVLTRNTVERLRMRNPMQSSKATGAWATDYEAMAKAKAIKQLSKYMPLSVEMQSGLISDEAVINDTAFSNNKSGLIPENFTYEVEDEQTATAEVVPPDQSQGTDSADGKIDFSSKK